MVVAGDAVKEVLYALCALSVGTGLLHDLELDEHGRILQFQLELVGRWGRVREAAGGVGGWRRAGRSPCSQT